MPIEFITIIQHSIKIALLVLIGLYGLFTIMLATKVRSFNKIVFLPPSSGATLIQFLTIFLALLLISLFFVTLVIV